MVMKKLYPLLLFLVLCSTVTFAQQTMKFGHVNSAELMSAMPDLKAVETQLETEFKAKENQLTAIQEELKSKQTEYQQNAQAMTPEQRAAKEQELGELGQKAQNYYLLAQQQLKAKENELKAPIIQKLKAAIQEVGDEEGFLYIFELSSGMPLYHSEKSVDVAPLVKAKLGIQ